MRHDYRCNMEYKYYIFLRNDNAQLIDEFLNGIFYVIPELSAHVSTKIGALFFYIYCFIIHGIYLT